MNRLTTKDRARILSVLCEGMGVNAACRVTGASKNTVLKLLAEVGEACALYQDRVMNGLTCKRIECDEIWSFVGMKERNVPAELKGVLGVGDVYTWTAIDADTKLVPCWHVGTRAIESARPFIQDLADRLSNRVQLTTDGHKAYLTAVEEAFGNGIDFAQLIKIYGNEGQTKEDAGRYSPAECTGTEKNRITGNRQYGLTHERLALANKKAVVMHPAPMNRAIEIADEVADDPQRSLIFTQMRHGVPARMAVLDLLVE